MIAPAFTRTSDWWEPKITLLLSIGLMVCYLYPQDISWTILGFLLVLLLVVSASAVYVSLINDYTDLEEDLQAGKTNRLQNFSVRQRKLLILGSVGIIALFIYLLRDFSMGIGFFIAAQLSYTCYSFPPIRLKARGIYGVMADTFGAHVFPAIGMFVFLAEYLSQSVDWMAVLLLGGWSFIYGLRGILSHQYLDRDHDERVGVNTFACQFPVEKISNIEWPLLTAEVFLFIGMLLYFHLYALVAVLGIYWLYAWSIRRYTAHTFVLILHPGDQPNWNILMAGYYQFLLPVSLLGILGISHPWLLLGFPFFVILFPNELMKNMSMIKTLLPFKAIKI
ncbi:UbiA family prenyltransferase [Rhodonellum sp.]|uniref:UbiA family prenyltransferase n=1 Tax=Rhodonellum sp. TaxID=2231180 RepID=UPI00271F1E8A|nr:UbiA family prenyltransferase [Rhodonellum sp.]MDO9551125.1 UbiA family prenyltransferase [Rhodonellum sp.]